MRRKIGLQSATDYKKLQNENKQANISSMQTAGRKNRSTMDNLIIMNPIIEKQKQDYKNTYILFAEPGML